MKCFEMLEQYIIIVELELLMNKIKNLVLKEQYIIIVELEL